MAAARPEDTVAERRRDRPVDGLTRPREARAAPSERAGDGSCQEDGKRANIVTVTQLAEGARCGWCHRPLVLPEGPGRPRIFCSPSHRQRAYEARRRAADLQIPVGQCIVSEQDLGRLHDRLYRLEAAVEDVTEDLTRDARLSACRQALDHLLDAAGDLVGLVVEPFRG